VLPIVHPEVLQPDWLPPVPLGRRREFHELCARVDSRLRTPGAPAVVSVVGPSGSGTSTLARLAGRSLLERWRTLPELGRRTFWAPIRVPWCRGIHGVACELFRRLETGFQGNGYTINAIVSGFWRRILAERCPAIIVLDDLGPSRPELARFLGAFLDARALSENGTGEGPPCVVILAGRSETVLSLQRGAGGLGPDALGVALSPYTAANLRLILRDRLERLLGRVPPEEWAARILERAARAEGGASRAMEILRRELLGAAVRPPPFGRTGPWTASDLEIEDRVLEVLARVDGLPPLTIGELKAREAGLARSRGEKPLPATTFWRRMVRLERAGFVRRHVRTGGPGGTRSEIELLRPLNEWPEATTPNRTLLSAGPPRDRYPPARNPTTGWPPAERGRRAEPPAPFLDSTGAGPV
jgi:hypothetical protein